MTEQLLSIKTDDGQTLAATWVDAQEPAVGMTVILAGELGYTQSHYAPFAAFLSQNGFDVLTFDYRSTGESSTELKQAAPRLVDCGRLDLAAMIEHARQARPKNQVVMIGHGVGGVLVGLATNNHRLAALLCVAASTGYTSKWPLWLRPLYWLMLKLVPFRSSITERGVARALGPAKIPASILRDWALWCAHPDAPVDTFGVPQHKHFVAWKKPIRCYSFSDDGLATHRAVRTLAARYVNAPQELINCTPENLGVSRLGHDGFFNEPAARSLWEASVEWLHRFVPPDPEAGFIQL